MAIDPDVVSEMLAVAAAADTTDSQGKAYEALARYLFEQVPGCIVESDITNEFKSEQIDLAVGNSRLPEGLPLLAPVALVECKDWSHPVDSKTVGYFINICAGRRVELGILMAANGITGDPKDLSYAHSLGMAAAPRGVTVIVITGEDVSALSSTEDFVELLSRRFLRAVATGAVGFPD